MYKKNKMKDLLLIIILLILLILFYTYLHVDEENIENFVTLPTPFLGPIEFVDSEDVNDVLGEYPENWRENVDNPNDYKVTQVRINRGEQGFRGPPGADAVASTCSGQINIEKILSDTLEINASEKINIDSEKIIFGITNGNMGEICFNSEEDEEEICLNNDLISKIKRINNNDDEITSLRQQLNQCNEQLDECNEELRECHADLLQNPNNYLTNETQIPQ
jgi:hypothetical protein